MNVFLSHKRRAGVQKVMRQGLTLTFLDGPLLISINKCFAFQFFSTEYGIKRTITTKDPFYQDKIGHRTGMSFNDIKLANLMYRCSGSSFLPR